MNETQVTKAVYDAHKADRLFNEQIASEFLGVTPRCLQKWRLKGGGPKFVRISSRCIRYRMRDLIEWSNERIKSTTTDV